MDFTTARNHFLTCRRQGRDVMMKCDDPYPSSRLPDGTLKYADPNGYYLVERSKELGDKYPGLLHRKSGFWELHLDGKVIRTCFAELPMAQDIMKYHQERLLKVQDRIAPAILAKLAFDKETKIAVKVEVDETKSEEHWQNPADLLRTYGLSESGEGYLTSLEIIGILEVEYITSVAEQISAAKQGAPYALCDTCKVLTPWDEASKTFLKHGVGLPTSLCEGTGKPTDHKLPKKAPSMEPKKILSKEEFKVIFTPKEEPTLVQELGSPQARELFCKTVQELSAEGSGAGIQLSSEEPKPIAKSDAELVFSLRGDEGSFCREYNNGKQITTFYEMATFPNGRWLSSMYNDKYAEKLKEMTAKYGKPMIAHQMRCRGV